jgi:hypothetical protein
LRNNINSDGEKSDKKKLKEMEKRKEKEKEKEKKKETLIEENKKKVIAG